MNVRTDHTKDGAPFPAIDIGPGPRARGAFCGPRLLPLHPQQDCPGPSGSGRFSSRCDH